MESTFTSEEIMHLGQVLDSTFGRTSTANNATASIKTTLRGSVLTVRYKCIVHFASDAAMHEQKKMYDDESVKLCNDFMNLWSLKEIEDLHDYLKMLKNTGYDEAFFKVNKNREPFKLALEFL